MAGAVIAGIGASTGNPWLMLHGASMVLGAAHSSLVRPKSMSLTNRDIGANVSDPVAGLPIIYGTMRVGGTRTFMGTTDAGIYLWVAFALAHGPVAGIDEVYLDGWKAFDANGRARDCTAEGGPNFQGFASLWKAYGSDGQTGIEPAPPDQRGIDDSRRLTGSGNRFRFQTSSAHNFVAGETVVVAGHSDPYLNGTHNVVRIESSTKLDVAIPGAGGSFGGTFGNMSRYTPHLATVFSGKWSAKRRGRGVSFVAGRLALRPPVHEA